MKRWKLRANSGKIIKALTFKPLILWQFDKKEKQKIQITKTILTEKRNARQGYNKSFVAEKAKNDAAEKKDSGKKQRIVRKPETAIIMSPVASGEVEREIDRKIWEIKREWRQKIEIAGDRFVPVQNVFITWINQ